MLHVLLVVIALVMAMLLVCIARLSGLFSRLLIVNSFGTLTVLLLLVLSVLFDQQSLVDIALLYALVNFVAPLVVLRFFEGQKLPAEQVQEDDARG